MKITKISALLGGAALLAISLALMPSWPQEWISALQHTSLATVGGTPYFAPIGTGVGPLVVLALLRWRRPEARLVFALACVPQTPLLYETVPLFLVPATIAEGGVLWLGSWIAAGWLSALGPYGSDAARFAVSAKAIGWCLYLPCVVMICRRPNVGTIPRWLALRLERTSLPLWIKGQDA